MDLLLILTYTAICVAVFKIFKIPLNKWTVPTALLGGVVIIGALLTIMNYNHPFSEISRQYFATTPVVPAVTGKVIEVPVKPNTMLDQGDVLFRLDPLPFQARLDSIQARLVVAREDVTRMRAMVARNLQAQRDLDVAIARLDDLKAQETSAQYELDQSVVRAPTRGFVTQMALRPGMIAASLPLRPVMVFVHDEGHYYVGWFRQNSLLRLVAGDDAEVIFDAVPGEVFQGKVQAVLPALAEGQVQPSGNLIDPRQATAAGRVPVVIAITDPRFAEYASRIPGGAFGQSAVYSQHFKHVAVLRKVLLRMAGWMNYIFPLH